MYDFNKKNRLTSRSDFQSVFKSPTKKISSSPFLLLSQANQEQEARLGMILPKARIKQAVKRNLVRRMIRESFRHQKDLLKGWNIIVLLRSEWSTFDKKAVRKQVDQLWRRLNPLSQQA